MKDEDLKIVASSEKKFLLILYIQVFIYSGNCIRDFM